MDRVKKGDKFRTIKNVKTYVLTSWGKPCTGSEKCIIPAGTILIANSNQLEGVRGFSVLPEKYKEMENLFIPKVILEDKDYSNYYFVFMQEDCGKYFEKV